MTPTLTEIEDRMLAMTEGEWIELGMGKSILESWFDEPINENVLRGMLARLMSLELLRARVDGIEQKPEQPLLASAAFTRIELMASEKGEHYLQNS